MRVLISLQRSLLLSLRNLKRNPAFCVTATVVLALGIGVNTALFAVVDPLFFRPPDAVQRPHELRRVYVQSGLATGRPRTTTVFTAQAFRGMTDAVEGLAELGAFVTETRAMGDGSNQPLRVGYASSGFFRLLGVRTALGRFPNAEENRFGAAANMVVISDRLWRSQFASRRDILAQSIRIDTSAYTVIGVAEQSFEGIEVDRVDVWLPLGAYANSGAEAIWWETSALVPELLIRARDDAAGGILESRLNAAFQKAQSADGVAASNDRIVLAPLIKGRGPATVGDRSSKARGLALRLTILTSCVFIIALLDVAALAVMRTMRRRREFAIRLALGASTRQLTAQLASEGLVLGAFAGTVAAVVTVWTGAALRRLLLGPLVWAAPEVDLRTLVLSGLLGMICGLTISAMPIAFVHRHDPGASLRSSTSSGSRRESAVRSLLLSTQSALCVLILVGATLLLRSVHRALATDTGFDPDHTITVDWFRATEPSLQEAVRRVQALPGIEVVSRLSGDLGGSQISGFRVSDSPTVYRGESPFVDVVDTLFLRAASLELIGGRWFDGHDVSGSEQVAVVSESLAAAWPKKLDALEGCVIVSSSPCVRVVGIVRDIQWNVNVPPRPRYFLPLSQARGLVPRQMVIRTKNASDASSIGAISKVLASLGGDPLEKAQVNLVTVRRDSFTRPLRVGALLFGLCGFLALVSASVGVYGLVNYDVERRAHDLGVRVAFGATPRSLVAHVLGFALRPVGIGVLIGVVGAWVGMPLLSSLLFELDAHDAASFALAIACLCGPASIAATVPAYRAAKTSPLQLLQSE